jgi:ParB family chromosome partitioning protein
MQKKDAKQELQDIDLKLIDEPDGRIRLDPNDEEIEELADNIKEVGQLQAILLAKKKGRYEIVAGERRFIAILSLGHKTIRAEVKEMTDEEIALARASENLHRKDLSPIEEGATYADLAERFNMSLRKIGDKFGHAASKIKRMIGLLALQPEIQKAIHSKQIGVAVGEILAQIDEPKERNKNLHYAIDNGCTKEVAEGWVRDHRRSSEPGRSMMEQGVPLEPQIKTSKLYQACEICEEPVEINLMKMLRICPGCFKVIIDNLKQGG